MKEDPPLDAKCRDKFLVQSVVISANDDASNVASIWANIEKTNKSSVSERKIRVNFLPAGGATSSSVNGIYAQTEEPPAYSSPSPTQFGSPAPQSSSETPKSNVSPTQPRVQVLPLRLLQPTQPCRNPVKISSNSLQLPMLKFRSLQVNSQTLSCDNERFKRPVRKCRPWSPRQMKAECLCRLLRVCVC